MLSCINSKIYLYSCSLKILMIILYVWKGYLKLYLKWDFLCIVVILKYCCL